MKIASRWRELITLSKYNTFTVPILLSFKKIKLNNSTVLRHATILNSFQNLKCIFLGIIINNYYCFYRLF